LIAFRRYSGTDGLVAACNAVISTGAVITNDVPPCDTADLTGGNI